MSYGHLLTAFHAMGHMGRLSVEVSIIITQIGLSSISLPLFSALLTESRSLHISPLWRVLYTLHTHAACHRYKFVYLFFLWLMYVWMHGAYFHFCYCIHITASVYSSHNVRFCVNLVFVFYSLFPTHVYYINIYSCMC